MAETVSHAGRPRAGRCTLSDLDDGALERVFAHVDFEDRCVRRGERVPRCGGLKSREHSSICVLARRRVLALYATLLHVSSLVLCSVHQTTSRKFAAAARSRCELPQGACAHVACISCAAGREFARTRSRRSSH